MSSAVNRRTSPLTDRIETLRRSLTRPAIRSSSSALSATLPSWSTGTYTSPASRVSHGGSVPVSTRFAVYGSQSGRSLLILLYVFRQTLHVRIVAAHFGRLRAQTRVFRGIQSTCQEQIDRPVTI